MYTINILAKGDITKYEAVLKLPVSLWFNYMSMYKEMKLDISK